MAAKPIVTAEQLEARLRSSLLAGSLRPSRNLSETNSTVAELRIRFLKLVAETNIPWQQVAEFFITHEGSLGKMRAIAGRLLGPEARDENKRDELFAEAGYNIFISFKRHRGLGYQDGVGSFSSWLYGVWLNAALHGLRTLGRVHHVSLDATGLDPSDVGSAEEFEKMFELEAAYVAIAELPLGRTREMMFHWAAGFSAADSARLFGISEARVSQLRGQGVARIREQLGLIPPANLG